MEKFDLQPLTDAQIQELGLRPQELWMIKIDSKVQGPFHLQALRHYSQTHEAELESVEATRFDAMKWAPFFDFPEFPKPSLSIAANMAKAAKIDVTFEGDEEEKAEEREEEKTSPHFVKLDNIPEEDPLEAQVSEETLQQSFDNHNLPHVPEESSFRKINVITGGGKLPRIPDGIDELISSEKRDQTRTNINLNELTLDSLKQKEFNMAWIWAIPVGLAVLMGFSIGSYFILKPNLDSVASDSDVRKERVLSESGLTMANHSAGPYREPSSVRPFQPQRSGLTQEPFYPTRVETHDHNRDIDPSPEPESTPPDDVAMSEPAPVVDQQEPQSLEGAMGGTPPMNNDPQAVPTEVMESSDF